MANIAVNPKVLEWARKEAQLTQIEAAERLRISPDELAGYESGALIPTLGLLRGMCKRYRLPLASLAMPEPLPLSPMPKDYRTIDGRQAHISPVTAFAIREARRLQDEMQALLAEED